MNDISLHILDLVENGIRAGARNIRLTIDEDTARETMSICIEDDGKGMSPEELRNALNPFYTTKKERNVGLGLPMMKQTAEQCGGSFRVESEPGRGTRLTAVLNTGHIDCPPLGDLDETIGVLITANSNIVFEIKIISDGEVEVLSTRDNGAVAAPAAPGTFD